MDFQGKVKLPVATAIKTHGVGGELAMQLTDMADPDGDFSPGQCLIAEIEGLDVPFFIASSRPRGTQSVLVTFDEAQSEELARPLVGLTFSALADPDDLAPDSDGDLTAGHLRGYTLIADGKPLGTIDDIVELTPGCWYLQLADGRLIPMVEEFITAIDPEAHTLCMSLPEGLAEL